MGDPNSIAWLCPAMSEKNGPYTWQAIRLNMSEDIPPQGQIKSDFRSRESTVSLEDEEDEEDNTQDDTSYPRLQLTFNHGPKAGQGLVLGTDPNCDIVLPQLSMISRRHCALTFDAQRRLILRDFSRNGTIVKYDDKGGETRRHFTWILGGHDVPEETEKIVIEIQGISFQIIVSTHDTHLDQYNANVDRFLQDADANNELPFGALGIQSTSSTAAPSGAHTPNQGPICLKQETLGRGQFAVVRRFWDVSTGFDYAYKEPHDKRKFDRKMWEKEADIMGKISHDHVVELVDAIFTPWPRLILEYVPFGSLEDLTNLSVDQCVTILCQGLSVLVDLHEREEPIVHRDIKPGNILLQSLDPLHIKFTDFGLSRASNDLKTVCGTLLYLAPEVYTRERYTPVVDIWSLGVVVYKLAYGLPNHHGYTGRRWCKRIIEEANDWGSEDLIEFLLTAMLVMEPTLRHSAKPCLDRALEVSVLSRGRSLTPTRTSYPEGYAVSQDGRLVADPHWRSSQHEDSIPSSMIRRYIRSNAPPPDSYAFEKSDPVLDLFGEGWLQDPNCVGSSVAAMGEDPSDWSSCGKGATEPSEIYVPGSIPEPVDEHNNDYDPHLIRDGGNFTQDYFVDPVAQGGGNRARTDSEGLMAARLLYAIREGERL